MYGAGFTLEVKLVMNYFHGAEGKKIGRMMENADESPNLCWGGCSGRCKRLYNVKGAGNGEETACLELRAIIGCLFLGSSKSQADI